MDPNWWFDKFGTVGLMLMNVLTIRAAWVI